MNGSQVLTTNPSSDRPFRSAGRLEASQRHQAIVAIESHWPEYLMEAAGLGLFMVSACSFTVLLEHPSSPVRLLLPSSLLRMALIGGTEWTEKDGNTRCSFRCNCLILGKVARPERFEIPAFWFVGRSSNTSKYRYWYSLRAKRATLFCP